MFYRKLTKTVVSLDKMWPKTSEAKELAQNGGQI